MLCLPRCWGLNHAFVEFYVFATVDVVDDIVGDINIHNDIYVVD